MSTRRGKFTAPALLGLLVLVTAGPLKADPVAVRFTEGVTRGFLVLRAIDGTLLAQGDLFQVALDGEVTKRMVFHFKDGSFFEETVVFTEHRVYTMQSYRLVQRGPAFGEDTEISLERASGKYLVKTKAHKDGQEKLLEGTLDLPPDVYNGMILTVVKDLLKGAGETVHIVAFTPKPRLIQLELTPVGGQRVLVGELEKAAVHYVLEPWLGVVASVLGRTPSLPRVVRHRGRAGVREIRGTAVRDGAGLADRADEPPLALCRNAGRSRQVRPTSNLVRLRRRSPEPAQGLL